jgi:uncharacterized protein YcnI
VTLQPKDVPAGGFVRVPNERDHANTTKVRVRFPPGFLFISYEPVAGWTVKVTKRKLPTPAEVFGEKIGLEVAEVAFTASRGAGIAPGQFRDFGLSLRMPDKAGSTLTFKALQTYDNAEVVRWIGPPDAEEPAPQVKLTANSETSATTSWSTRRWACRARGRSTSMLASAPSTPTPRAPRSRCASGDGSPACVAPSGRCGRSVAQRPREVVGVVHHERHGHPAQQGARVRPRQQAAGEHDRARQAVMHAQAADVDARSRVVTDDAHEPGLDGCGCRARVLGCRVSSHGGSVVAVEAPPVVAGDSW